MQKKRLWIWEHAEYPKFTYAYHDIDTLLFETIKTQGILEGVIKYLSHDAQTKLFTETLTDEIIHSASIEGEILKRSSVRSSIRKQFENLEVTFADRHTDNIVSIQKDLNENHQPLTLDRLHQWHHLIMTESQHEPRDIMIGEFRDYDEMLVVSGEGIRRKVHYQAPPAKELPKQIEKFLNYCNDSTDHPLIKSAIAHIWFVQIHPYDDGNGRMTRNITNHILSKELGLNTPYFSISHAINRDIKSYGNILETSNALSTNPEMNLTLWIKWHTQKIETALNLSIEVIEKSIKKTKFYEKIKDIKINESQSKIIDILLTGRESIVTNNIYRSITGATQVTASRHLSDLVKKGILKALENQKGRSTAYELDLD